MFNIPARETLIIRLQVNWWVNNTQHPIKVPLGFDSSADFHTYPIITLLPYFMSLLSSLMFGRYGINITDTMIEFSVDGKIVYTYKEDFTQYLKPMQMFMKYRLSSMSFKINIFFDI